MTFGSGGPSNLIPLPVSRRIAAEAAPAFDAESTLAELYQSLGGRAALQRRDGEFYSQLEGLSEETNPELFFEAIANLATGLESRQQSESAAELHAFLSHAPQASQGLQNRSRKQLQAILGRGDVFARAEHLGRRLASDACDPAALAAMGLAGTAFRLTRFAALSRLAAAGTESIFTRGLGAQLLAGTAGFLLEVPTFTLTQHGAATALGREVDWSATALRRDLASGALMMLSLRGMGALSRTALGHFATGNSLRAEAARFFMPQAAMLGGLILTRRLEEGLGWRPRQSGATVFTDAFATLLQFHAGGRLAQEAFGEHFSAQERRIEAQTAVLEQWNSARIQRPLTQASARRPSAALAALGTGVLTLLQPGLALAQDGPSVGGMHIFDPMTIATVSTLLVAAAGYAAKRILTRNQTPAPEYYSRHRGRIIAGRGGEAPSDADLPGEAELIRSRLLNFRNESLYRKISRSQLEAVLFGSHSQDQGAFRNNGFDLPKTIGPRVFEVGVNEETGQLVQILELTEALPQTPAPEQVGGETYLRVAQLTDLQQYSDAQQCPILVLPIQEGSEYFLGIPLRYQEGGGYRSPFFENGFAKLNDASLAELGGLGNLLDRALRHSTPRSFIIDNDGEGYLLLDRDGAQVEFVLEDRRQAIEREGARVNGKTLSGDHPGSPLNSGDQIQSGEFQMRFLAPRPAFPLGLLRTVRKPLSLWTSEENEDPRSRWLWEQPSLRRVSGRIMISDLLFPGRRMLPDLVMEAPNGDRIVLSPRLSGDERVIAVGANPGLTGIYLHGAWDPRAPRFPVTAEDTEFFLRTGYLESDPSEEGSGFLVGKAAASTFRLLRNGVEISLEPGEWAALRDNDILEVGPPARRTQFRWYRDLDAMENLP